jgi:hypothetical protein
MEKEPITKEMIENFESNTGAKVIDAEKMIIEYGSQKWRPIKNQSEFLCICFDNEPVLNIGELPFVAADYQS